MKIDVCVVAGRRPELLEATLRDFSRSAFVNFSVQNIIVNIDPIFGSDEDAQKCVNIIQRDWQHAVIFQPDKANFCAAVKRVWTATKSNFIFHLEDDWRTLTKLDESTLAPFSDDAISQVSLHTKNQNWDIARKGHLHQRKNKIKILGLKLPTFTSTPLFSTSPSILRGEFARICASMMDESFDPEKQFYSGVNKNLEKYVSKYKKYIFSPSKMPVIEDIGREWRDKRGIEKLVIKGTSTWTTP